MQSLSHTLALGLMELCLRTTKLKLLQKNSAELTEFFLNLDTTFQWKFWLQYTTACFSCTFYMVQQFGAIHFKKNVMKIFIFQKRCMRLITFSQFQGHTTPISRNCKILKLQNIIKFNTLNLIYLYYKDQLPWKIKDIFTTNESVNLYNIRGGKLLFIPQVNTTYCGIKSLRYNGPVIWNDFFRNIDNNKNLYNTGISKFKYYLKDLLISQYNID